MHAHGSPIVVGRVGLDRGDGAGAICHGSLGHPRFRDEALEAVRGVWVDVELDGYAGSGETTGVGDALVAEDVEVADVDVGGRESGEVG